jgi:hypothetical protein
MALAKVAVAQVMLERAVPVVVAERLPDILAAPASAGSAVRRRSICQHRPVRVRVLRAACVLALQLHSLRLQF